MDWLEQFEKEMEEAGLFTRKLNRRDMCAKNVPMFFYVMEAIQRGRYYCRDWRECPICFRIKADGIRDRMVRAQANGYHITVESMTEAESKKLVRKLGDKKKYMRIPQPSGMVRIFVRCEPLNNLDVNAINWDELTEVIPLGKSISGSLGKMPKKVFEQSCTVPTIVIQGIKEEVIYELDELARAAMAGVIPTTPEELEAKLIATTEELVRLVKEAGGEVFEVGQKTIECHFPPIIESLIDKKPQKIGLRELESIFGVGR